jgi:antitoxin component YwqK of YwqJK toxin-antitoxin module
MKVTTYRDDAGHVTLRIETSIVGTGGPSHSGGMLDPFDAGELDDRVEYYDDGSVRMRKSSFGRLSGFRAMAWYPNGQKADDWVYSPPFSGEVETYWERYGHLKEDGPYSAPEFLFEEAQPLLKIGFGNHGDHRVPVPKDGTRILWHDNGARLAEISYADGVKDGDYKVYSRSGALLDFWSFHNGQPKDGQRLVKDEHGTLREELNYLSGRLQGPRRSWNAGGVMMEEMNYLSGQLQGPRRRRNAGGALVEERNYNQVVADSPVHNWGPDGKRIIDIRAVMVGPQRRWQADGKPIIEQRYGPAGELLEEKIFYGSGKLETWRRAGQALSPKAEAYGQSFTEKSFVLEEEYSELGHRVSKKWFKAWADPYRGTNQDDLLEKGCSEQIGLEHRWDEKGRLIGLEGRDAESNWHDLLRPIEKARPPR